MNERQYALYQQCLYEAQNPYRMHSAGAQGYYPAMVNPSQSNRSNRGVGKAVGKLLVRGVAIAALGWWIG